MAFILAAWGLAQGASAGATRPTISASFDTTSNPPVLKVSVSSSDVPRSEHLTATVWGEKGGGWVVLGYLITGPTRDGANNANITVNNIMPYGTIVINALLSSEDVPLALTPHKEGYSGARFVTRSLFPIAPCRHNEVFSATVIRAFAA